MWVLGLELGPLDEEVVGRPVEQLARQRECLDSRDALHVHDLHLPPEELRQGKPSHLELSPMWRVCVCVEHQ